MANSIVQNNPYNQGVSLYLAIVVLSIMTAALLSLAALSISQTRVIFTIGDSVLAFYAADTGAERVLYRVYKDAWEAAAPGEQVFPAPPAVWETVSPSSEQEYHVFASDFAVESLWSTGNYRGAQRKIEVSYGEELPPPGP